jgi:hypothetical protein
VLSTGEPAYSAATPEVAIEHFREVLRAKQERVRQGPSYPAPNPYSGRPAVAVEPGPDEDEGKAG